MKKFAMAVFLSSIAVGVVAQETKTRPAPKPAQAAAGQQSDPVIIRFGSTEVRQSEFEGAIKTLPQEYQEMAKGPARRSFAEEYVRMKMLAVEAERQGLEKEPEVQAQLRLVRDNTLANAALSKLQDSIKVSDADLQKAYEEEKSKLERVKARHILIAFEGSPAAPQGKAPLTDAQAKAKAEEIRKKLLGGADFAELAKTESHDTASGARGGDLGEFGRGDMVPEFENAAFTADVGKIAPIVRTQFGYHIIKVEQRGAKPLAEVRAQLEQGLRQRLVQERLDAMKKAANASFDETYFPPAPAAAEGAMAPPPAPETPAEKPVAQPKKP